MEKQIITSSIEVYDNETLLPPGDRKLLEEAREAIAGAYAPYSGFKVGAAARLRNGQVVRGANQENASFPAGLCAERVALAAASSLYPDMPVEAMAITYLNTRGQSDHPVSPCGICRQILYETERRWHSPIRLILSGQQGKAFALPVAGSLLPLAFGGKDLE
jgi:cytidine deaminase